MRPSPKQDLALRAINRWSRTTDLVFYLGGFAGSGKSTIANLAVGNLDGIWLFAALTGKAAHVMRRKGCHGARTLHSLIYRPAGESKSAELKSVLARIEMLRQIAEPSEAEASELAWCERMRVKLLEEQRPQWSVWADSPLSYATVRGVVVDECSMIDDRLGEDLESFGKKILVLGDPAQLPPVGAPGRYSRREPDFLLDEVHRQARESGVLRLATSIREGGSLLSWDATPDCRVIRRGVGPLTLGKIARESDQILVGRNVTRRVISERMREIAGRSSRMPEEGDRVVALRNERETGLLNGSQWRVAASAGDESDDVCSLSLVSEDDSSETLDCSAWTHHFLGRSEELLVRDDRRDLSELDWGYALTVHKAQGSQWPSVLVFDESGSFNGADRRRWLYTAVTRASRELTVVT